MTSSGTSGYHGGYDYDFGPGNICAGVYQPQEQLRTDVHQGIILVLQVRQPTFVGTE
jgi:hypothetical protein